MYISELFWNFLSFIHNNRIIMGGGALFFVHPLYVLAVISEKMFFSNAFPGDKDEGHISYESLPSKPRPFLSRSYAML